jgi:UDP-N-acetylmuramoyl-L-alanyl-D-glutamate--2,6-diaminopimelate ligase
MDEHGSYENYRAAKARLLSSLEKTSDKPQGNPRLGVINRDDLKSFDFLNDFVKVKKINYGVREDADVRAVDVNYSPSGVHFTARSRDFSIPVSSKLVGAFNISNCLAALTATVYGLKIKPEIAARGIASLQGIPGRMERIDLGQNFTAIVDFAHTPNALKVALEAARALTPSPSLQSASQSPKGRGGTTPPRVIAVFGSADEILEEMAAGARSKGGREGETFWRVPDRGAAIRFALRLAREGDIVLSCGKGHEQSMCFGAREHLWDDRTAMQAALSELLGVKGPQMPYLPTQNTEEEEWLTWK